MVVESLESRRLMSATVTQLGFGVLRITGSAEADVISVVDNDEGGVNVVIDNDELNGQTYNNVRVVMIDGRGGNDLIGFQGRTVSSLIAAGAGDDTVFVTDGGTGSSVVTGGTGNDQFFVDMANNTTIFGGAGDDEFFAVGVTGQASFFGQTDNDYFEVSGDVFVSGGSGTDSAITYDFGDGEPVVIGVENHLEA